MFVDVIFFINEEYLGPGRFGSVAQLPLVT